MTGKTKEWLERSGLTEEQAIIKGINANQGVVAYLTKAEKEKLLRRAREMKMKPSQYVTELILRDIKKGEE